MLTPGRWCRVYKSVSPRLATSKPGESPVYSRRGFRFFGVVRMKTSERYRLNAENCAALAGMAKEQESRLRFLRMEQAWRALALDEEYLEGMSFQEPTRH